MYSISTIQYNTVQYSTVQYSTVQHSTVQYSTVPYRIVQSNHGITQILKTGLAKEYTINIRNWFILDLNQFVNKTYTFIRKERYLVETFY